MVRIYSLNVGFNVKVVWVNQSLFYDFKQKFWVKPRTFYLFVRTSWLFARTLYEFETKVWQM